IDWRVADDLPFRDIRVGVAYVLLIATLPFWLVARRRENTLVAPDVAAALFAFTAVSYAIWLKMFAIYRYIVILEMLSPLLIAAAVGLWPLSPRARLLSGAAVLLWVQASFRVMEPARAPAADPYVQAS